jgi:hypothetical protein
LLGAFHTKLLLNFNNNGSLAKNLPFKNIRDYIVYAILFMMFTLGAAYCYD